MTAEQTLAPDELSGNSYRDYKREQEVISRHKIYKTTALYSIYAISVLVLAIRAGNVLYGLAFVPLGIVGWMLSEYTSHRYIFHFKFTVNDSTLLKKFFTTLAVNYLDPMHTQHHERPFDGNHMSGRIRDLLPLFIPGVILGFFFFPVAVFVATWFMCYLAEEWIHHATHFYNFRDPYFRYMKKHHMYHHTKQGMKYGFGTTSGILDYFFGSRYPEPIRQRLYGKRTVAAKQA
jgi:sterol desaturase/sphingolipid hydroxylase (fatty acid hydroxylase superfamily)